MQRYLLNAVFKTKHS